MLFGQAAQLVQEFRTRHDQAHVADHRLEDDAGNPVAVKAKRLGQGSHVVVAQWQGIGRAAFRHAGTVGHAQRSGAGAGLDQQAIDVAVVAAGELDDHVPSGEAAGQADGAHRRLGAGADQAHHLDRRHRLHNQLGKLRLPFGGSAEAGTAMQSFLDGPDHARMGMAEDERPPRTDVIEVTIAVDVVEIRPFAAGNEDRLAADAAKGAGRTVDAAGNQPAGQVKCFGAAMSIHGDRRSGLQVLGRPEGTPRLRRELLYDPTPANKIISECRPFPEYANRGGTMLRPEALLAFVRAQPFRPFRIVMNSGKAYEIRHPELIRVGRDFFNYYHATPPDAPAESWETVSLILIQNVQHLDQPATSPAE